MRKWIGYLACFVIVYLGSVVIGFALFVQGQHWWILLPLGVGALGLSILTLVLKAYHHDPYDYAATHDEG